MTQLDINSYISIHSHLTIIILGSPPRMSRQNGTGIPATKQANQLPQNGSVNATISQGRGTSDDEDLYALPGPIKATASQVVTNDATPTYYNVNNPLRDHQLPIASSENQLVTGSTKMTKKPGAKPAAGPTTLPKPTKGKSLTMGEYTLLIIIYACSTLYLLHSYAEHFTHMTFCT